MAEETDTPRESTRKRKPPQVVYLYGAAADRRNKIARRSRTGRVPRQVRLGADMKTVVRRNKRIPVTLKWLKANIADVKSKIADGLIWVEDSSRKRAPEEWLREMGLYTDPSENVRNYPTTSKAAYNDNLTDEDESDDDDGWDDEDLENTDDEDETGGLESEEDDQDEEGDEPEGDEPEDDPSDDESMDDGLGDTEAMETSDTEETASDTEEASDSSEDVTTPVKTAGKPLPEGWADFVKRDLLALMNERDMPIGEDTRNDTLLATITTWAAERGLE